MDRRNGSCFEKRNHGILPGRHTAPSITRVEDIIILIIPHDQRQWQEETDSFKGDSIMLETRCCHTRYLWSNVLFILYIRLANRNCLIHKLLKSHSIWNQHSQKPVLDGHFYYRVWYLGPRQKLVAKCFKSPTYPVFICA